jgi:hypothetical protein
MILQTLHTISGGAIFLSLAGKIILHYNLAQLHVRNLGPASVVFMPLPYLWPYEETVSVRYLARKHLCNLL